MVADYYKGGLTTYQFGGNKKEKEASCSRGRSNPSGFAGSGLCKLLYARVFGELSFKELGMMLHKTPHQTEMTYYYILRKLRKEMEGRENEF